MTFHEKWIWLPADKYPQYQTTKYSHFCKAENGAYVVAEFKKHYSFEKNIACVNLRFSADTEFQLFCNDEILATGPVTVEGDFIGNEHPRCNFYATRMSYYPNSSTLDFFARVKLTPVKMCEYSKGHGGFMLTAHITFEDGTKTVISTDKTWQVRYNGAYCAPYCYDEKISADEYVEAEEIDNIWHTVTAPIPVRTESEVFPQGENIISINPHEEKEVILDFDMIYAGFIHLDVKTKGILDVSINCKEIDERGSDESFTFIRDGVYRGIQLHSAGKFVIKLKNDSEFPSEVSASMISTYYPVKKVSKTVTSDDELNKILEVCTHTLKFCRQLHHLDSPRHCEPLACTGDYYIESLMTAFSFGDMSLVEFDIIRTAELLRNNDGRMFHTTYSLIWVRMMYDVYMFTGNKDVLKKCEDALILLLKRFETYIGDNGLIETPPDFMFIDWIYIDGLSMHHPPKALGQTCLNMFYFGALDAAAKIYRELSEDAMAEECICKKETLRKSINSLLYDKDKGLYFEGLNTATPEELLYQYMPKNTEKRYYLKHSNILAAYFGVCDSDLAKVLIDKIVTDECPGDYQPYFAHYLLEAIFDNGLRDKYTLKVLEKWREPIRKCDKGLVEGFIAPEPTYFFDHSHAWGGTPLYSLPKAISGLKILKPGLSELSMSPSLIGLESARVEIPTPYGDVVCEIDKNKEPIISAPKEITVHISE